MYVCKNNILRDVWRYPLVQLRHPIWSYYLSFNLIFVFLKLNHALRSYVLFALGYTRDSWGTNGIHSYGGVTVDDLYHKYIALFASHNYTHQRTINNRKGSLQKTTMRIHCLSIKFSWAWHTRFTITERRWQCQEGVIIFNIFIDPIQYTRPLLGVYWFLI